MAKNSINQQTFPRVYCDPRNDRAFKFLFSEQRGKQNMLNFLRALLPHLGITDIAYLNTEQMGHSPEEAKAIYDLVVLTKSTASSTSPQF